MRKTRRVPRISRRKKQQADVSASEVVKHEVLGRYTEAVEHALYGFRHGAGAAHVVLDVFGCVVILEVGVVQDVVNESSGVLHACGIGGRIGSVEGDLCRRGRLDRPR